MGLLDGFKGAAQEVAHTGIGLVENLGKGALALLFPSFDSNPGDIVKNAVVGTMEAAGDVASGALNAGGHIAWGAGEDVVSGIQNVVSGMTHIPNSQSAQLPSQSIGTGGPSQTLEV